MKDEAQPIIDTLDPVPFRCAKFSFCPNPCCFQSQLEEPTCELEKSNPCGNLPDKSCSVDGQLNEDFIALVQNEFNLSCRCVKGFIYHQKLDVSPTCGAYA